MADKRQRQDRSNQSYPEPFNNSRPSRESRPPLQWEPAERLKVGVVVAEISKAQGIHNILYSFSFSRVIPGVVPEKLSKHFREPDFNDLAKAVEAVEQWIGAAHHKAADDDAVE